MWIYRIVIFAGAILIAPWTAQVLGERPTWQVGYYGAYGFVGVMLMGLALTWWGANPSWRPLVKRDYAQGKTSAD